MAAIYSQRCYIFYRKSMNKLVLLFVVIGINCNGMELAEKEYEEKTSFLESYMAAQFVEIDENVIVKNYEKPEKIHTIALKKARGILLDADKITMEAFRKNEFKEVIEASAKLPDASRLTQRDKFYMQLISYAEFLSGDDFNIADSATHKYAKDCTRGYLVLRNYYKTQWLVAASPEEIKKVLALELYQKNDPYIPLVQKIQDVCNPIK